MFFSYDPYDYLEKLGKIKNPHQWVWGPAPVGRSRICSVCGAGASTWTPGMEEIAYGPTECPSRYELLD